MELRDLIVTPIVIILIYFIAYYLRPFWTDSINRKYFIPALTVKIVGALAVGFIYQFYYSGGDTFKYHTYGSRALFNILIDSPEDFFNLFIFDDKAQRFYHYYLSFPVLRDQASYFTAKIILLFDLLTFSSYSASAALLSCFSFLCMWKLYTSFYKKYPHLHKWLAVSILFFPSVFFWGSGIMKDTITMSFLALATSLLLEFIETKSLSLRDGVLIAISFYVIFSIKKYILLCFLPSVLLWLFVSRLSNIRSIVFKIMVTPVFLLIIIGLSYFAVTTVGEGDEKYAVASLAKTAKITAYDIRYQTGKDAGSGYELGDLDGSFFGMIKLIPKAINVSLFRPYLWEVKNPLMVLTAIESFLLLILTGYLIIRSRGNFFKLIANPDILFCLIFSLSFAFAVGVSTFNFGTLSRYKIPLLPFYSLALVLGFNQLNKSRKEADAELIE